MTDRQQLVRLGKFSSSNRTISTGAPQGCVLSPLLFFLYTNDGTSKDPSVKLLKYADDTTLICLIQDGGESAYRQEVKALSVWCSLNHLELNTCKIVDFRRNPRALPPLTIMNSTVTAVESFRFLGTTIFQDLKWDTHIDSIVKKAIIESVLCTSITDWFSSATKSDNRRLRSVVRSAEWIIGTTLPTLTVLIQSEKKGWQNNSEPLTSNTLPLWTVTIWLTLQSTRMGRHRNSFFSQAIHLMNTWH